MDISIPFNKDKGMQMLLVYCMSLPLTPLLILISIWGFQKFVPIDYYTAMYTDQGMVRKGPCAVKGM